MTDKLELVMENLEKAEAALADARTDLAAYMRENARSDDPPYSIPPQPPKQKI